MNQEQMKLSGFEPDQNLKWEKIGEIPAPDGVEANTYNGMFVKSVAIDSHRVLIINQAYGNIHQSYVGQFDTRTGEWSNEGWPSLNQPRYAFSCLLCNGKVYVIGGNDSHDEYFLNSIECLDLSASPRQWITMDQGLQTARQRCQCVAIGTQIYIIGGYNDGGDNKLMSVEILNTETGQLVAGPDMPQHNTFTAAAVNNKLFVFARSDGGNGKVHSLQQAHPSSTWFTTSCSLPNEQLVCDPIVIGDCVALTRSSVYVYDTQRDCSWTLPRSGLSSTIYDWTLVDRSKIIALLRDGIYVLKLKMNVEPSTGTMLRHAKAMLGSMLFSPHFSDVLFVCSDGTEIPAHRNVLAANNSYFQTYFSGRWSELHSDGRWETNKSSDVIKALLSLIYTGEDPFKISDAHLLELLETVYEFELDHNLVRVCQAKCIANITLLNVKNFLLSAKRLNASFLFDTCFKYVCEHYFQLASDHTFALDIINDDEGKLWNDIVQSSQSSANRKRPREESND
jgi:hypothetical protein